MEQNRPGVPIFENLVPVTVLLVSGRWTTPKSTPGYSEQLKIIDQVQVSKNWL